MIFYKNRVIHEFCDILLPSHNRIASLPKDLLSTLGRSLPRNVLMSTAGNSLPCDCNLSLVKLKLVSGSKAKLTGISFSDFNVKVQMPNVIKLQTIFLWCLPFQCGATSIRLSSIPDSYLRCPLNPGELQGVDLCDSWYVMINTKENQEEEETVSGNESIWNSYIYTRDVKDCRAFQLSPMAINLNVRRVWQAQKDQDSAGNLLLCIAPRGVWTRRGNTKEIIHKTKKLVFRL